MRELGARRSELGGPKSQGHHAALAKRFEKEFPERKLSYLVQYGVYGLLGKVAEESSAL